MTQPASSQSTSRAASRGFSRGFSRSVSRAASRALSRGLLGAVPRGSGQSQDGDIGDVGDIFESFIGRTVIDDRGATVGTVADVVYENAGQVSAHQENADQDPSWLLVDAGWGWTRRYVPIDGTYPTAAGDLVVPFDRSWVRAAPRARSDDETLSYETRRRLATHYGDDYEWWPRRRAAMFASA